MTISCTESGVDSGKFTHNVDSLTRAEEIQSVRN